MISDHSRRAARSLAASMKKFMPMAKKERQARRECIDVHASGNRGAHVFAAICEGECEFLHKVRARLLHVVARDRDRVEFRHVFGGVFDDVRDDPHRWLGRIDVGVADHEFFENVVLDGACKQGFVVALLFACHDEVGEDRDHRTVHRHGHADFIQRDAVKEDFHVLDAVDRHASLANIPFDAGVVAVIATVGCQIECDGHALLTACQCAR